MAWHKFFIEVDPDIIIGYNITQFDVHYLLERASVLKLVRFPYSGRIKCRSTFSVSNLRLNFYLQFARSAMTSGKADLHFPHALVTKDVSFSTYITIFENTTKDYKGRVLTNSIMFHNVF